MGINKQAELLNQAINKNPHLFNLLSNCGKEIYFPKEGIVAQAAEAKDKKINATIGEAIEDDGTPMRLQSIAKNILMSPTIFKYASTYGDQELRKKWHEMILQKNPSIKTEISLPIVTAAVTHGLTVVGHLFVNQKDEVLVTDKYWGNYKLTFENIMGAKIKTFNTFKGNSLDLNDFERKMLENGKKIAILNFPNNPTGYAPTNDEAEKITKIMLKSAELGNEIVAICDDAYFGLIYENDVYPESIFSKLANLHENILAIKLDGATKEDYVWGFRVGFITYGCKNMNKEISNALEAKTAGVIRATISNVSNLSQKLILNALNSPTYKNEKIEKYNILKRRYQKVKEILKNQKYSEFFAPLPYNSGYFMCVELKNNIDAEEIRQILLKKYDTGVIALNNLLRIAFSSVAENQLQQLFDNIYLACKDVKK